MVIDEIVVKADVSEIENLIDQLGDLQTYKLYEGAEQTLVDLDEVVKIFADHVEAEVAQPELPEFCDKCEVRWVHGCEPECKKRVLKQLERKKMAEQGRLIDKDALLKELGITDEDCTKCEFGDGHGYCAKGSDFSYACDAICTAPTVEERKKGKWHKVSADKYIQTAKYYFECSECGGHIIGLWDYCPNCGADMRKTDEKTNISG